MDNLLVGQVVLEILEHLLLALNFLEAIPKWLKMSVIVFTIRLIYLDNCLLIKSCGLYWVTRVSVRNNGSHE